MTNRLKRNTFVYTKGGPTQTQATNERKPWEKRPDRNAKSYDVDRLQQVCARAPPTVPSAAAIARAMLPSVYRPTSPAQEVAVSYIAVPPSRSM